MNLEQDNKNNILFEELHIRHLNLLIELKNTKVNNWFYKMAIINTLNDLKIILNNLEKNKNKCIIAIQNKKIISYIYTHPINQKKTCLKINIPQLLEDNYYLSKRDLILSLIKNSISNTELRTSSWIINSNIMNKDLISCARELGFQPLQEIKLWKKDQIKKNFYNYKNKLGLNNFIQINKSNIKKVLNFVSANESILMRNILDLEQEDIYKRTTNLSGALIIEGKVIFALLKDISYPNENVYSLIKGISWDERLGNVLASIINHIFKKEPNIILKTYSNDNKLNNYLFNLGLIEKEEELILIRNTLIKRDIKSVNKINKSLESILGKINPQNNPYPSPLPVKTK